MTDGYGSAGALLPPLAARLPGLASALSPELTARRVEQTLLRPGAQVRRATPGSLWYQPDGSCSLRYRLAVSDGTVISEHTVLARVYPSADVAGRSLPDDEGGSAPLADPPDPWRAWRAVPEAEDITLSLFPVDPALPTLPAAMDLAALSRPDWPDPTADPVSVELVHHSRQGAAVLRYGVRHAGSSEGRASGQVYGKVYPDRTTGQRVHRFLRSCATSGRVRLPRTLGYSPTLNLGLTEALPGQALLPDLVRSATASGSASEAMAASGRALAALHAIREAAAPELTVADLTRELGSQLDAVEPVWPQIADQVRSLLGRLGPAERVGLDGNGVAAVLCHGDFTPSQVLLAGDTVCGVVDFDTVCWSEEAMDLGRFLAHLDLLATKEHGESARPLRQQLADSFVAGYADSAPVLVTGEPFLRRIAVFRSLSLASTALHACRQLKERRMRLALSLLDQSTRTAHYRPGKALHDHLV